MRTLGTLMVCTVEASDAVHVAACWDGGPTISLMIEVDGRTRRVGEWAIWNEEWDAPLIQPTRESFERFVVGRLSQTGVLVELVETAAAVP
jgi:hypothetical protein